MDHLPDPAIAKKYLEKMRAMEERDQKMFSERVELEEAAVCTCTRCPPRDQLEEYDYCCQSLLNLPLKKSAQLLRDGLKAHLKEPDTPCICLNALFKDLLLTETAVDTAIPLQLYNTGKNMFEEDENRAKRYACYRVIIAKLMGVMGRGHRIRLPACVIQEVRNRWPSPTYTGFKHCDIIDD